MKLFLTLALVCAVLAMQVHGRDHRDGSDRQKHFSNDDNDSDSNESDNKNSVRAEEVERYFRTKLSETNQYSGDANRNDDGNTQNGNFQEQNSQGSKPHGSNSQRSKSHGQNSHGNQSQEKDAQETSTNHGQGTNINNLPEAQKYWNKIIKRIKNSDTLNQDQEVVTRFYNLAQERLKNCKTPDGNALDKHCVGRSIGNIMQLLAAVENTARDSRNQLNFPRQKDESN